MTGFATTGAPARTDRATASGLIVHEWVERWGGAERVLDAMMDAFPDAGVRVLWNDTPVLDGREVTESWIARTPLRNNKALALPAMLPTWRMPSPGITRMDAGQLAPVRPPREGTARNAQVRLRPHARALHLGARARPPRRLELGACGERILKPIDRRRAAEATSIAVNSRFTGERVARAWEQPSQVIYPPVDTKDWWRPTTGARTSPTTSSVSSTRCPRSSCSAPRAWSTTSASTGSSRSARR